MPNTVISFPIPPYANLPIEPQNFQPSRFIISAIALGITTTVTTTVNHNYVIGQQVRLIIPLGYGSRELNGIAGFVMSLPAANQVELNINSQNASSFINAGLSQQPEIIAIGDINLGLISSTGRVFPIGFIPGIPGNFENISN